MKQVIETSEKRLLALDAARGLAVIGMYVQHFALNERNSFVSENTMILFMLCSGISYSIMIQKMMERGIGEKQLRTKILSRAVFIDLVGYILIMLNGPFAVVLPAYAMIFLLALTLLHCQKRTLFIVSGGLFLICPPLMTLGLSLFADTALLYDIAGGPLSALAWAPVFVAGMAVGKMDLKNIHTDIHLIISGAIILIPFKLIAVYILPGLRGSFMEWLMQFPAYMGMPVDEYAVWPKNTQPVQWHMLLTDVPQGGSMFELLIGVGGSLILFGTLCLMERKYCLVLKPFCGVGRMALTLYVAQFVIAWLLLLAGDDITGSNIGGVLFGDVLVAVIVLIIGCLPKKNQNGPFETAIRCFEQLFQ